MRPAPVKYLGPLRSRAEAQRLAARLEKLDIGEDAHSRQCRDAAAMLRRNWHYIAARPEVAWRAYNLSETRPLDVERPGSVMHRLIDKDGDI